LGCVHPIAEQISFDTLFCAAHLSIDSSQGIPRNCQIFVGAGYPRVITWFCTRSFTSDLITTVRKGSNPMMILRTLLFSAVFLTALLTGYKAGEIMDPIEEIFGYRMDAMIMPGVTIPDNNQYNLLIIGVDDINRVDAQLESIWLAAQAENSSKITLIPIFPSPDNPDQNLILTESFSFDGEKPGKEFWNVMRKTNFWWKGYLVSDINTAIGLIDELGGISIHNQPMTGVQAIGSISSWKDDPQIAVFQQKIFLESICNQISTNQDFSLKSIKEIINQKFRSDARTKIYIADWTINYAKNEIFSCNFPTFTQTSLQLNTVSPR
jgi:hypothetical protein